jgi:hypothetical protein
MQRIAEASGQPASVHPVIGLQVPDCRLDRLATFHAIAAAGSSSN